MNKVARDIQRVELVSKLTDEQLVKLVAKMKCQDCILIENCKSTVGGGCENNMLDYLKGVDW